jgi:hypothetical protein
MTTLPSRPARLVPVGFRQPKDMATVRAGTPSVLPFLEAMLDEAFFWNAGSFRAPMPEENGDQASMTKPSSSLCAADDVRDGSTIFLLESRNPLPEEVQCFARRCHREVQDVRIEKCVVPTDGEHDPGDVQRNARDLRRLHLLALVWRRRTRNRS